MSEIESKLDDKKLNDLMGKMVNDLGAASSSVLVVIGLKLGLFMKMEDMVQL